MDWLQRREFITLLGSAAAVWPLAARAQQPDRVRRIGVLIDLTEDNPEMKSRLVAFRRGLNAADGWRAVMSTSTFALRPAMQISIDRSRKSCSPCNPT